MAFRSRVSEQLTLDDSFNNASKRVQRVVMNSWAKDFSDVVFPAINGDRFKVLYADHEASRPTTPANYIVGALLIKEMFGLMLTS